MNDLHKAFVGHLRNGVLNPDSELRNDFGEDAINNFKEWLIQSGYAVGLSHPSSRGDRPDGSPDFILLQELTEDGERFVKEQPADGVKSGD